MVVTVFSVSLTWGDVVLEVRASIVETGIYFPDGTRLPLPFHSDGIYVTRYLQRRNSLVEVVICSSLVDLRELTYNVEFMPPHHLVFIVAVLVQTRFMVITITQRGNQSL